MDATITETQDQETASANAAAPWEAPDNAGLVWQQYYTFAENGDDLILESGKTLGPITLAYETYGALNADKSNAVLVLHALSGDAHAAGYTTPEDRKPGWWDAMIGPGKAFDTNKYFMICSNVIGGCKGSTGPASINPKTGKPYALDFPIITIADMVKAQTYLIKHLGIEQLLAVVGGSMGGMQALQWAASYPEMVKSIISIAAPIKQSAQQIAFNEVVRQAIMADEHWHAGDYYAAAPPAKGLSVARMIGHITFMSEEGMEEKFARRLKNEGYSFNFDADFEVEGYLRYRGNSFVGQFDANSYIYITKALDYFDLSEGKLIARLRDKKLRFLIISFDTDWLYPSYQSKEIVQQLKEGGLLNAISCDIKSRHGHDSFLIDFVEQTHLVECFLRKAAGGFADEVPEPPKRLDYSLIIDIVPENAKVLDLGCGNGELMRVLSKRKQARTQGLEVDAKLVHECVDRGVSVFHNDVEIGLSEYPDQSFDYILLNQSMQEVRKADYILHDALRVADKVIVGFPNFANRQSRSMLFFQGMAPTSKSLPYRWYDSPNVRFLSVKDFKNYCNDHGLKILREFYLGDNKPVKFMPNLRALNAVFVITKQ